MRRAVFLASLLLAGCVTELLADDETTTRNIACLFLTDPGMDVVLHIDDPGAFGMEEAATTAVTVLANDTGRDATSIRVVIRLTDIRQSQWDAQRVPLGRELTLYVLVLDRLGTEGRMVDVPAPGAIRLAASAMRDAANRTGMPLADVAAGALLHGLGHVLGVVNRGIPIADVDPSGREGVMHHEPQPGLMHADWHNAASARALDAYRYSDGIRHDWQVAKEGVCA